MKLHSTYHPNISYVEISALPKAAQKKILDPANLEFDRSRYTMYQPTVFLRGEITLEGINYTFEVTLYRADVSDLIDGMDEDQLAQVPKDKYNEDEPSEDWIIQCCMDNARELLSYGESHHETVYLTEEE